MTLPPWPKYPCHPCSTPGAHDNLLVDPPFYAEADGYYWHSAKWDRITGKWDAVCHEGHRKHGRSRTGRLQ